MKTISQANLTDFKTWLRKEGGVFVSPNDKDCILQVVKIGEEKKIAEVKKDSVIDLLTLGWNHRCVLGCCRNRVEVIIQQNFCL